MIKVSMATLQEYATINCGCDSVQDVMLTLKDVQARLEHFENRIPAKLMEEHQTDLFDAFLQLASVLQDAGIELTN